NIRIQRSNEASEIVYINSGDENRQSVTTCSERPHHCLQSSRHGVDVGHILPRQKPLATPASTKAVGDKVRWYPIPRWCGSPRVFLLKVRQKSSMIVRSTCFCFMYGKNMIVRLGVMTT